MFEKPNAVPHLHYSQEFDRWMLSLPIVAGSDDYEDDRSYSMAIEVGQQERAKGWFCYRFIRWDAGDWVELISEEEMDERVTAILEHEGREAMEIWIEEQNQVEVIPSSHKVYSLRKRWEAMMELELFFPSVTQRRWEGKSLSKETRDKIDAARQRALEGPGLGPY